VYACILRLCMHKRGGGGVLLVSAGTRGPRPPEGGSGATDRSAGSRRRPAVGSRRRRGLLLLLLLLLGSSSSSSSTTKGPRGTPFMHAYSDYACIQEGGGGVLLASAGSSIGELSRSSGRRVRVAVTRRHSPPAHRSLASRSARVHSLHGLNTASGASGIRSRSRSITSSGAIPSSPAAFSTTGAVGSR